MLSADKNYQQRRKHIAAYYDTLLRYYEWFWHGSTGGVHYGLQTERVRGWHKEIVNTNVVLASIANISPGSRVLDAGCGVGGSAIWLHEQLGCRVEAVTLSLRQAAAARQAISARALQQTVDVLQADNHALPFGDASFDVVWGLESICYADKALFLAEAARVLKPGGTLIIGDGFLLREPDTHADRLALQRFVDGLALEELIAIDSFTALFDATPFGTPRVTELTAAATPSSRRLYWMCLAALPMSWLLERCDLITDTLTRNILAGVAQGRLVNRGLAGYFAVAAEKSPEPGVSVSP